MRPEEIARSIEGAVLAESGAADDAGTAARIVYARANSYTVPSAAGKWTTHSRLILGIDTAGVVQRWEIDTDELIESSGQAFDASSLRAAVSRLYAEQRGYPSEEPEISSDLLPPTSPGPGDPELDL